MTYRVEHVSVSQCETHERCERLWYFKYPMRLPGARKRSLIFGTAMHAVLEAYLKGHDDPFPHARADGRPWAEPATSTLGSGCWENRA